MTNTDDIFAQQRFGQRLGFGSHPALLLIDLTRGFCDPDVFGGGNIESAARQAEPLLQAFRRLRLPVVHTKIVYAKDGSDANLHTLKVPRLLDLTDDNPMSDFVSPLQPEAGEIVVRKKLPSAFFGTDLAGILAARRVDTLIIGGCTTSGCVRASVLDAVCLGFRPMVVKECVGDRHSDSHQASLRDMDKKYADVLEMSAVDTWLQRFDTLATRATPR